MKMRRRKHSKRPMEMEFLRLRLAIARVFRLPMRMLFGQARPISRDDL